MLRSFVLFMTMAIYANAAIQAKVNSLYLFIEELLVMIITIF